MRVVLVSLAVLLCAAAACAQSSSLHPLSSVSIGSGSLPGSISSVASSMPASMSAVSQSNPMSSSASAIMSSLSSQLSAASSSLSASGSLSGSLSASGSLSGSLSGSSVASSASASQSKLPDMQCNWGGKLLTCKGVKHGVCCRKVKYCCPQGYRCDPHGRPTCVRNAAIIIKPVIVVNTPTNQPSAAQVAASMAQPQAKQSAIAKPVSGSIIAAPMSNAASAPADDEGSDADQVVVVLKNANTINKGDCKTQQQGGSTSQNCPAPAPSSGSSAAASSSAPSSGSASTTASGSVSGSASSPSASSNGPPLSTASSRAASGSASK